MKGCFGSGLERKIERKFGVFYCCFEKKFALFDLKDYKGTLFKILLNMSPDLLVIRLKSYRDKK